MADKIKGWVDQFMVHPHQREQNENITVQDHKWLSGDLQCTLVVTDERVFTESEVRAMAADMIAVAVSEANTVYPSEQHAEKGVIHAMRETIERHGVSLDPA